ncbi:MAG: hypothetical protein HY544_05275 [Candidatus Diapherotrites archaeon]|uniref:Uncharacterized protein n=1 Tax=Candidatus Iainarchaeum sp. TaxID=3101447 RepID=A0A8T3YK25_9ARCH|nr:hypothetical protein [Candidatus Diapherotrites archaeon]
MGYFGLAVKGLYAGAAYMFIAMFLEMQFPGTLPATAFQDVGIFFFLFLFVMEFIFDYT